MLASIEEFENDGVEANLLVEKLITAFKEILINIKADNYNYSLDFDNLYNLILELNSVIGNLKYNVNSYDIIQVVLLKYFPGNKNDNKIINNIEQESTKESKSDYEEKTREIEKIDSKDKDDNKNTPELVNESKSQESNQKIKFAINIRINNTLVSAKKENLDFIMNFIKEKYKGKIYTMGTSGGANIILMHAHKYPQIKKILAINPVLNINFYKIKNGINQFDGNITMICGENDLSSSFCKIIKNNVKTFILKNIDHNFSNHLEDFINLPFKYLFTNEN